MTGYWRWADSLARHTKFYIWQEEINAFFPFDKAKL